MSPLPHRLATYAAVLVASLASLATSSSEGEFPDVPSPLPSEPALMGPGPLTLDESTPRVERYIRFKSFGQAPPIQIVAYFQAERLDDLRMSLEPVGDGRLENDASVSTPSERGFELSRRWSSSNWLNDGVCPSLTPDENCTFDARLTLELAPRASGDAPGPVVVDWWEVHLNDSYAGGDEALPATAELLPPSP